MASALKAKVALIEKEKMGGECLYRGCVPSKALIKASGLASDYRRWSDFGLTGELKVNFSEVMNRVHRAIARIAPHDSPERYGSLGVDCKAGKASLISPWEVKVGEEILKCQTYCFGAGAKACIPDIPGLKQVDYLTSDTFWALEELPKRLLF